MLLKSQNMWRDWKMSKIRKILDYKVVKIETLGDWLQVLIGMIIGRLIGDFLVGFFDALWS